MPNTIGGYEVAYTHRGSWKANRSYRGRLLDEIPVAWDRDWQPGSPPSLTVWFQDADEADQRLRAGYAFVVAVAKKVPGGASSKNINRLFEVTPTEVVLVPDRSRSGLLCTVLRACPAPGEV